MCLTLFVCSTVDLKKIGTTRATLEAGMKMLHTFTKQDIIMCCVPHHK